MFFKLTFGILNIYKNFDLMKGKLNKICRITSLCFLFPYCISTSVFPVLPAFNKWSIMDINWTIFDWQFTKAMFCSKQYALARISTEWSDLQALTTSTCRQTHTGSLKLLLLKKEDPYCFNFGESNSAHINMALFHGCQLCDPLRNTYCNTHFCREPTVGLCQVLKVLDTDCSQQQPLSMSIIIDIWFGILIITDVNIKFWLI